MFCRACAAALGIALVSLSCAPKRAEIALDTSRTSAVELIRRVAAAEGSVHSMTGRGSVSFESPELNGSAYFDLSLKKPDSLLVKFEGPFGIDVGLLFACRERYLVYNSLENRVITGSPDAGTFRSVIPFDLSYEQILDAFSGVFPIIRETANVREYSVDGDCFYLSFPCGDQLCEYWVDPGMLFVSRYRRLDAGGKVLLEAVASRLVEQEGAVAPRRITVTFPSDNRRIAVYYTSFSLNVSQPPFGYTIPRGARTTVR